MFSPDPQPFKTLMVGGLLMDVLEGFFLGGGPGGGRRLLVRLSILTARAPLPCSDDEESELQIFSLTQPLPFRNKQTKKNKPGNFCPHPPHPHPRPARFAFALFFFAGFSRPLSAPRR